LSAWHEQHEAAAEALREVESLPAHVVVEAYSVLTRLPSGLAVPAAAAASVLTRRFGRAAPLRLADGERATVLERLAAAGVSGGATYDGLVALEASAHGQALATLDERAASTYRRLGVPFVGIGPV
jgi:predicted nucleic acid-binding protein